MRYDLLVIGDSVLDIYLSIERFPVNAGSTVISPTLVTLPGGPSGLAIIAAKLGLKVAILDRVGNDQFASALMDELKVNGVETGFMKGGGRTAVSINIVDSSRKHSFIGYLGEGLSADDIDETLIMDSKAIFFEGYNLTERGKAYEGILKAARIASSNSRMVFFDPGPMVSKILSIDEFIGISGTVFLNEEESASYTGLPPDRAVERLAALGERDFVVKLGERGAVLISEGTVVKACHAFRPSRVENTIGAGDAFDAAYIAAIMRGQSKKMACELANLLASIRISKGLMSIPTWDGLLQMWESD
ncbi:MAG: carbohydrate kinase family protein [Nitrososphaeria archaeon]